MEYFAPSSWNKIERFYKDQGKTTPIRYRLCTRKERRPHAPILLEPSVEDLYKGPNVLKCTCDMGNNIRLARNCENCCEKCPECEIQRKHILAFDYLPFGPRIAFMCKSKTSCFEFLEVWRKRDEWLEREVNFKPPCITQFWHGTKMREVQGFWNPKKHWELPVRCGNPRCNSMYRAFPKKCEELQNGWKNDLQKYQFHCLHCNFYIDQSPSIIEVFKA